MPAHVASGDAHSIQTKIYTRPPSADPQIIRGRYLYKFTLKRMAGLLRAFASIAPRRPARARTRVHWKVHRVICVFLAALIDLQIIRTRTRARRARYAFPAAYNSDISRNNTITAARLFLFVPLVGRASLLMHHFFLHTMQGQDRRGVMRNFTFRGQ